ncbi:pantetheine-phosphate adenylyltransferase [Lacticaseibacillus jixianensis]|uniref:Phosphopantetheine adenylyltransferase n=1 Tax=Lacticaseibacillus jixianensis TaxID=2486012 RepID=A0ABW4BA86_9LACO|nr:pantetheine-phosphate adenylyltransferase [Lacticaseibacillus jixianensis]
MVKAIFPGSFDPFTNGHLDTVARAAKMFDTVVVAVMTNTAKRPLFTAAEKLALIKGATAGLANVDVVAAPAMLTVKFAQQIGATVLVRGVRSGKDLDYEQDIAEMNQVLSPQLETVLLLADKRYRFLSSSLIKEVATFGGDVSSLLPANVNAAIGAKLGDVHEQAKTNQ